MPETHPTFQDKYTLEGQSRTLNIPGTSNHPRLHFLRSAKIRAFFNKDKSEDDFA